MKNAAKTSSNGSTYEKAKIRIDGWINTITGIGTLARDKVKGTLFERSVRLPDQTLENLYNGDDIAAAIVGKVVDDALRGGYEISISADDDDREGVSEANAKAASVEQTMESELFATTRIREGWTWGRCFGGGAIYVVTDEGFDVPQDEPLDEKRLRKVLSLMVLDKRDLTPATVYSDPTSPKFGQVSTYRVNTFGPVGLSSAQFVNVEIHETRLICFGGALTTNREKQMNEGWSLSVLQRPYDVLQSFNSTFSALANLLQDASQGIFKMDGLIDMIASGEKDAVQSRMSLVDLQRSVARSLVIDAEKEDFTRLTPTLSGYPESMQVMMVRLAAAAGMPVTVLFGVSPAGLNATGESDRLLWAQTVETQQRHVAQAAYERLAQLVFLSSDGPTNGMEPEAWSVVFPPLIHMTEEQQSAIRKMVADTDAIYIDRGVTLPEEVALSRFRPTGYSSETSIDLGERKAMLQEEAPAPERPLVTDPTSTEPALPVEAVDPGTALNGAQVKALQDLALAASTGQLPKATAIRMIAASFPISEEEAARILEDIVEPPPGAPFEPGI